MVKEVYKQSDWLEEKYHGEELSIRDIGDLVGVTGSTIKYWMEKHGIDRRDKNDFIPDFEQRFWSRIDKGSKDECWEWTGGTNDMGYGHIHKDDEKRYVHRVMYELKCGDIGDMYVLHECDNPPCVNPDHLHLGTPADNMQEAVDRGRIATELDHGQAKLSSQEVREIRDRYSQNENTTQRELAEEYGVCRRHIGRIVNYNRRKYEE